MIRKGMPGFKCPCGASVELDGPPESWGVREHNKPDGRRCESSGLLFDSNAMRRFVLEARERATTGQAARSDSEATGRERRTM